MQNVTLDSYVLPTLLRGCVLLGNYISFAPLVADLKGGPLTSHRRDETVMGSQFGDWHPAPALAVNETPFGEPVIGRT